MTSISTRVHSNTGRHHTYGFMMPEMGIGYSQSKAVDAHAEGLTNTRRLLVASSVVGPSQELDYGQWLPAAAEQYNISSDIKDYVLVPNIPIILSDVPNTNGIAFEKKELLRFIPAAGKLAYQTFKGKPCVAAGTLIPTDKGLLPIEEISRMDVSWVMSHSGPTRLVDAWRSGYKKTLTVHTVYGRELRVTEDHQVMVLDESCRLVWKEAAHLEEGDVLVSRYGSATSEGYAADLTSAMAEVETVRAETYTAILPNGTEYTKTKHQLTKTPKFPDRMTRELARLLGYLTSEGHVVHNLSVANTNAEILKDVAYCVRACFGLEGTISHSDPDAVGNTRKSNKPLMTFVFGHKELKAWIHAIGVHAVKAPSKRVPWSILQSSREYKLEFLKAAIEGDGSLAACKENGRAQAHYFSASKGLANDVQALANELGFSAYVSTHLPSEQGQHYGDAALYKVTFGGSRESMQFISEVGTVTKHRGSLKAKGVANMAARADRELPSKGRGVPFLKTWARRMFNKHATGSGPSRKYWSTDKKEVLVSMRFIADNQGVEIKPHLLDGLAKDLGKLDPKYGKRVKRLQGMQFDVVQKLTANKVAEPVYDLETESHSFIANGVVVHNCFIEHDNADHTKAKGVILDVYAAPLEGYGKGLIKIVEMLAFDRTRDPDLCRKILSGERNAYSMGASFNGFKMSTGERPHKNALNEPLYRDAKGRLVYKQVQDTEGFETSSVGNPAYISALGNTVFTM